MVRAYGRTIKNDQFSDIELVFGILQEYKVYLKMQI